MAETKKPTQIALLQENPTEEKINPVKKKTPQKTNGYEPPNLGKAIRLPVPDFNDPGRPPVCLEVDFPIAPINALSNLEGNAGKPIYQMSKWWARRRSSVFRSMLIAAATEAPNDPTQAAKLVWDHYYCNHQKAGAFKKLRVLDIFMGGGTTLVEGARLGFQMTGIDLNPVAWFVTRNELSCSDPEQVKAFFDHIEAEVKPQVQPFYTTTCPRGHKGHWIDRETGKISNVDPVEIPYDQRDRYQWEGPEIIYTFWAKHGPCQARGCGHRTPIFRSPVIAEKRLTSRFIPVVCPSCGLSFNVELGETRMAPGTERVVLDNEPKFTETSQEFAQLIKDYGKGNTAEKQERVELLVCLCKEEGGLLCPRCNRFAGQRIYAILERHRGVKKQLGDLATFDFKAGAVKKKELGIESRHVYMYLLIHPKWLEGASGFENGEELGGYAGADPEKTARWFEHRLEGMCLIEVRGRIRLADEDIIEEVEEEVSESEESGEEEEAESEAEADRKKYGLPCEIVLTDGTRVQTRTGTVPEQSTFLCKKCGQRFDIATAERGSNHHSPVAAYALQCHCPQCESEGYNYNGRYFKAIEPGDVKHLIWVEREWADRKETDLADYWPRSVLPYAWETHVQKGNLTKRGYTHWWKMFNPRQLLAHTQLLRAITEAPEDQWPLDVREQALGAFQQYLRNQNMFAFWNQTADKMEPMFSNANYHPKQQVIENCVFHMLGRGNWQSSSTKVIEAMEWTGDPWELVIVVSEDGSKRKSEKVLPEDPIKMSADVYCGSSTTLTTLLNNNKEETGNQKLFDLVITDPPFGNNLFYADLADFFYVWMRRPLLKWYSGMSEEKYFEPEFTPKAIQAIDDGAQHPDDREDFERERFVTNSILSIVRNLSGNKDLTEKDPNPLYRSEPSSEFYQKTLTACWAEAGCLLKPSGLMAFTFHHNKDAAWVDVLESLFDSKFVLVATYPIRSDETKGNAANAAFGAKLIEYDIIHVCRKRLEEPQPVSWARMRRWVKEEAAQLKELLEHSHGKELPESDLLVILRGKALEFYSRHYGQVYTGDGQVLGVRDALLGINQLLEDLLVGKDANGKLRPPDTAEPASRLFLRIFQGRHTMARDELHKILRGTGVSQGDIEARCWIRVVGTTVHAVPVEERFKFFTAPGRNRKVLKSDLDQALFLIGAAMPGTGVDISEELNRASFQVKKSADHILDWYAQTDPDTGIRQAAALALELVSHWRAKPKKEEKVRQLSLFESIDEA